MAELSPISFYKTDKGKASAGTVSFHRKLRQIEEKSKVFENRPLSQAKNDSVFAPYKIWEIFLTQAQALDYAEVCRKKIERRVSVLSQELSSDGKRHFVVTTFEEFWKRYNKMPMQKRNFYEVIQEGSLCRLYFDLEFYKEENPGLQGTEILQEFIHLVCFYLLKIFNINCSRGDIFDLDSSTEQKFSRHLIFHFPDAVFVNNVECGNFVSYIHEMAKRKLTKDGLMQPFGTKSVDVDSEQVILPPENIKVEQLFLNNKDGSIVFFADLGVYTRNRNFRLLGSTKFGKNAHLVVSDENGFHGSHLVVSDENGFHRSGRRRSKKENNDVNYCMFLDTLVCYHGKVNAGLRFLAFKGVETISSRRLYPKKEMQCKVEEGYRESPYPELDAFIATQIRRGGVQGVVRRWMYFNSSSMMLYDIDKNHFCEHVNRPHKSNHIYFIVDMKHGVFYQKCHDPDCVDFKSKERELPQDVNPVLNGSDFLINDFDDNSNVLSEAVEVAECHESLIFDDFSDPISICEENSSLEDNGQSIESSAVVNQERLENQLKFGINKRDVVKEDVEEKKFLASGLDVLQDNFNPHGENFNEIQRSESLGSPKILDQFYLNEKALNRIQSRKNMVGSRDHPVAILEDDLEYLEKIDFEDSILDGCNENRREYFEGGIATRRPSEKGTLDSSYRISDRASFEDGRDRADLCSRECHETEILEQKCQSTSFDDEIMGTSSIRCEISGINFDDNMDEELMKLN